MKQKILNVLILTGIFLGLTNCNNSANEHKKAYIESQPSFFELKNSNWVTNKWIRKPENLLIIHETFKKIGYSKLISTHLLADKPIIIQDIYINQQANNLLDSLELTYAQTIINAKYYREFWHRRKREKNDKVVFKIIKEINFEIRKETKKLPDIKQELVNDTLFKLLQIELRTNNLVSEFAKQDFEMLRKLGFHQSAYNLLFETAKYENLKWNKDSLKATLKFSDKFTYSWFVDNTK